jgi:hypothetical protein
MKMCWDVEADTSGGKEAAFVFVGANKILEVCDRVTNVTHTISRVGFLYYQSAE